MSGERLFTRSMSPQERADYTYGKVENLYVRKVAEAEQLRRQTADGPLNSLLGKFASTRTQQNLEDGLQKRRVQGADIGDATDTVDLGMAGLFRIGQTHENSMTSRDPKNRSNHIRKALNWYERHERPISVRRTTDYVNETIHGGVIHWRGEVVQDLIRTYQFQGRLSEILNLPIHREIQDETRKTFSAPGSLEDPMKLRKLAGLLSAMGMINIQLARATRNLGHFTNGYNYTQDANKFIKDPHRLATVSMWLVVCSWDPRYKADSLGHRAGSTLKGIVGFSKALKQDYKSAFSALRQAVTRKG